jgi:hypothetical protein
MISAKKLRILKFQGMSLTSVQMVLLKRIYTKKANSYITTTMSTKGIKLQAHISSKTIRLKKDRSQSLEESVDLGAFMRVKSFRESQLAMEDILD